MSLIYRGQIVDLESIPVATEVVLKKEDTELGKEFRRTVLGYTKGAISQYRGPKSTHIREYKDYYTIHRDAMDPRNHPIRHLINDAPQELAGWVLGGLVALIVIIIFK